MALPDGFDEYGFLSEGTANGIADLRLENAEFFSLTDDINKALMLTAVSAKEKVNVNLWDPKAVAIRILLRSCGTMQAIILLTERGMVTEGRTHLRSLIENAICIAALDGQPDEFVQILRNDSDASRQRQRKFIVAQNLVDEGAPREALQAVINEIGNVSPMNLRDIASLGPLEIHYLAFQRLSDDSSHLSAKSLDHHVLRDAERQHFQFRWCIGNLDENSATLYHAVLAALAIGISITQILEDWDNNANFGDLTQRFQELPKVPHI